MLPKFLNNYEFPLYLQFSCPLPLWRRVIDELPAHLKKQNLQRPLVVTDPTVANLAFFHKLIDSLKAEGLTPSVFHNIHKNPVKSDVLLGGDAYAENNCDSIVGIGGGAAMDVARAIVLRVNHRRDLFDYDDLIGGDVYVTEEVPYFVTVPTTSGTGSEVGRSAVISEDDTHRKRILFAPKLLAKMVFADPELTLDLPPFVTAATGMDALTHNMEAYLAKMYHPICDGIALEGMAIIAKNLEKATNSPDIESRTGMMIGSSMGAIAFQKGLGVVHSLAHPLSTLLDMHHGLANAIMIPYGMKFNVAGFEDRFATMARTLGLKDESGEAVINWLFELNKKLGLPTKLSDAGVKAEHLDALADLAIADFAHPNNPKPVTREDFRRIYDEAL